MAPIIMSKFLEFLGLPRKVVVVPFVGLITPLLNPFRTDLLSRLCLKDCMLFPWKVTRLCEVGD